MSDFKDRIESFLSSSENLSRRHVHPRLLKMFELGGMNKAFVRAEGQYLWDAEGERYLDLLAGGGVYFLGRNHPRINGALIDVLSMNLPNLCVVNASILGGMVAEKLLALGGPQFTKVVFANAGSESTEVALRFARQATRRRRFLYVEGAFHGRSYGAISVCGFESMRKGIDPAMPTCTPIPRNDLGTLRRELAMGDVAGLIFEPVQGMTGLSLDPAWLREAESLCEQHGSLLIADEVQTGLGRTGAWFATREMGVRPHIMTVSKTLSGGQVPVGAVLVNENLYDRIYSGFGTGLVYFSTFAENNLAMASALATLEVLEEMDAPAEAAWKGEHLRRGLEDIASRYDCIDSIQGKGLMVSIYFKDSSNPGLLAQQKVLKAADPGAFAAAVHVDLFKRQRIIGQIPGPGIDAIKILPPVIVTQEDLDTFLGSFEDTIARFYGRQGPIVSIGRGFVESVAKRVAEAVPATAPAVERLVGGPVSTDSGTEKKNSPRSELAGSPGIRSFVDYEGPIREEADFVVVGSGPGGATVAYQLARAGKRVVVLEAGPQVGPEQFQRDVGKTLASFFWEGGTRSVRGNVFFPTLQVRALGGGSVFNSAICMRPLDSALRRWQEEHGLTELTAEALAPHFDAVEAFYGIKAADDAILGRRNLLFREACEHLGWEHENIRRFEEGCVGSGECILGCRHGAKTSMDRRGIAEVAELGGRVYTSVHVDGLLIEHGRVRGVEGWTIDPVTHVRRHPVRIRASATILAAGAIGTPVLMRRSGLRRDAIGDRLLFHPSCYVTGVFDEEVNPWFGATQGVHTSEHLERGIKLEALWATASTFSRGFPKGTKQFKRYLKRWPQMAVFDGWISGDASVGRVRVGPAGVPDLTYQLGGADQRRLQETNALLCEMFGAVGAREVITGVRGLPEVQTPQEALHALRQERFDATNLPTASNHVMGGTPMGSDPDAGAVCDAWGQVYDADDLYVADTGLYPSSPGVNPQLTAMALAWRLGEELPQRY